MSETIMAGGTRTFQIWRGQGTEGNFEEYTLDLEPGMVVLDAVLEIQRSQAPDLAVRWNCKAAKCGSCSAEVNGKPSLMCMTQMSHMPPGQARRQIGRKIAGTLRSGQARGCRLWHRPLAVTYQRGTISVSSLLRSLTKPI